MKAEELMVGDWVRITDDDTNAFFDAKVGTLTRVENIFVVPPGEEMAQPFSIDCVEPIHLTPEILEKNGFKAGLFEELVLEADEYCFALQKGVDGINAWWWEMYSSPIIPINYVHELQHVLRLCGIDKTIEL